MNAGGSIENEDGAVWMRRISSSFPTLLSRAAPISSFEITDRAERRAVYRRDSISIDFVTSVSAAIGEAFRLLWPKLKLAPSFRGREDTEARQREFAARLLRSLFEAHLTNSVISYSRNTDTAEGSTLNLRIVDCFGELGLCKTVTTKPRPPRGGIAPKQSRLVPTDLLASIAPDDPWTIRPYQGRNFVYARNRDSKKDIRIDRKSDELIATQEGLKLLNDVNSQFHIRYRAGNRLLRLRPIHFRSYTKDENNVDLIGGRIYCRRFGHQGLDADERATIEFGKDGKWEGGVELDYGCFHPLMLYHLRKIDFVGDAYAIDGPNTAPALREVAKLVLNAALNAQSRDKTIGACIKAMKKYKKLKTGEKVWRDGKTLARAIRLDRAQRDCGLSLSEIYDKLLVMYEPIAVLFGADAGIHLQKMDGQLCLRILTHFANLGVPCLGIHDSFIVPAGWAEELRRVMKLYYYEAMSFWPRVE